MTETIARRDEPLPLSMPVLLSFVAGYVDSYTYLGLFGLFVAQVTGSFVIAGAEFVTHDFGIAGKLLAIVAFLTAAAATAAHRAHTKCRAPRAALHARPGSIAARAVCGGRGLWPIDQGCTRLARHRRRPVRRHGDGRTKRAGAAFDEGPFYF